MKRWLPPLLLALGLCALSEGAASMGWVDPQLLPPPSMVFASFQEFSADYQQAFFETATNTLMGYLGASFLGILMALTLSLSVIARRALLPFAIFFQTVPIIAIAPLLVIYLGFGAPTVIASSLIVAIFPVLANGILGLESQDPQEEELFRLSRASSWQLLLKLKLPRAYPSFYSGLKIAAGLSVIGSVAGEFVAGSGLGALIDSARTQQRIDLVFGCLLLLSVLGLGLMGGLRFLNGMINRYRPYGLLLKDGSS